MNINVPIKLVVTIGAVASVSCVYRAPIKTSGPTRSIDGIELALMSQDCQCGNGEMTNLEEPVFQIRMQLALANPTQSPLYFYPERLRLEAPDGVRPPPVSYDAQQTLAPGERRLIHVRFMTRGSFSCTEDLKLDPADSIMSKDPVRLPPILFTANAS